MDKRLLAISSIAVIAIAIVAFIAGFHTATTYYIYPQLDIQIESGHCAHLTVWLEKADGTKILIKDGVALNNAGILTNIGKDFVEGKLSNPSFANNTKFAVYIGLSSDASTPSASWVELPNEITTGGLARAEGTYQSTGVGQWTVTYQFTATAQHTGVRLAGLYWDSSGKNLFCVDSFTSTNLDIGDKLTVIYTITAS